MDKLISYNAAIDPELEELDFVQPHPKISVTLETSAQPQRTGRWLCSDDMYEYGVCSLCRYDTCEPYEYVKANYKYCPHCFAMMENM